MKRAELRDGEGCDVDLFLYLRLAKTSEQRRIFPGVGLQTYLLLVEFLRRRGYSTFLLMLDIFERCQDIDDGDPVVSVESS